MSLFEDVHPSLSPSDSPVSSAESVSSLHSGSRRSLFSPLFIARVAFGSLFVAASVDKIYNPGAFAQVVYNYQLLPDAAVNLVAILLPWLEILLGLLILLGLWLPGALCVANLLLVVFSSSLLYNLFRGLDVHCGCFSVSASTHTSAWVYILRDIAFLSLGGYLIKRTFR